MKRFLTAITTYGSPGYVDLGLTLLNARNNEYSDFIVCDDKSGDSKLQEVCGKHDCCLLEPDKKAACADIGDMQLAILGLEQAAECGYDYYLKVSRSWIFKEQPYPSLIDLIDKSGGYTYSNQVRRFGYGFNTACICLDAKAYADKIPYFKAKIAEWTEKKPTSQFLRVECCVHQVARQLQPDSEKYRAYQNAHPVPDSYSGYVVWDWMGNQEKAVPPYIIWHDDTSRQQYLQYARDLGLDYNLQDFNR